jgi:hypothetical protein
VAGDTRPMRASRCPGCMLRTERNATPRPFRKRYAAGAPQVMALLRNLAIGILKTAGHTSITAACRHHSRDATRTLTTLGLTPA